MRINFPSYLDLFLFWNFEFFSFFACPLWQLLQHVPGVSCFTLLIMQYGQLRHACLFLPGVNEMNNFHFSKFLFSFVGDAFHQTHAFCWFILRIFATLKIICLAILLNLYEQAFCNPTRIFNSLIHLHWSPGFSVCLLAWCLTLSSSNPGETKFEFSWYSLVSLPMFTGFSEMF